MSTSHAHQDLSVSEIEAALSHIDPNLPRDEWARIGMSIKSELGESGFDTFDSWSARADSYDKRDCKDTWRSIKAGGGVGIGTLIHVAKQGGYRRDNRAPQRIDPAAAAARRAAREAEQAREASETEARQARAAADAAAIWEAAQPYEGHAYAERKGITRPGAVRVGTYRRHHDGKTIEIEGALLIPARSAEGKITTLQAIFASADNALGRDRDYMPGGRKQGSYFNIGKPTGQSGEIVLIGEGYATVATAAAAMGAVGVVAFDAGNLLDVARVIRAKLPEAGIVMLADNDAWGRTNTGVERATDAARAIDGLLAVPTFPAGADGQPTDFNDLLALSGLDAVREQINAAQPVEPDDEDDLVDIPDVLESMSESELMDAIEIAEHANDNEAQSAPASAPVEPLDIFADAPVPAIDYSMLPDVIARYAADCAERVGVTPGMIAIPAIVACAAALHDGVKILPKRYEPEWQESARLWCAIVGNPSVKKSPAIKRATRRIRKIDMDLSDVAIAARADHERLMESYREAQKAAKKSGEHMPPPPEAPRMERMVVEDITVEALSEVLKDNPRGILAIQDELSGWLGSMDAYSGGGKSGGKDRSHWLQAYNGGGRVVDRVMRGSIKIPNFSVSMIGGIQPDAIRRISQTMTDDGLMQRFIFIIGASAPEIDRPGDDRVSQEYSDLVDHLHRVQPGSEPVTLTEDAHAVRERLCAFADSLVGYDPLPGGLRSHLGKWSGLFARLCLIYHAIECADLGAHPVTRQVTRKVAEQVERLMRNYLLPHAMAYYTDILGASGDLEQARWIAGHILSKSLSSVSNRDLTQHYKQWRGLDDWRRTRIMQMLEDMGWVAPVTDGKQQPRRGATSWTVNVSVHSLFSAKAADEAQRREKIRAEIALLRNNT